MKVGTDGVLLGAWANCDKAANILDIGAGSGLVALMLAQRSTAFVHSLDIDGNACRQAEINYKNSPFNKRITIEKADFQIWNTQLKFDLLVSNPPYFADSPKPPDTARSTARHNDTLQPETMLRKSISLMSARSRLAVILPVENSEQFHRLSIENKLFPCRKTFVTSLPHKPPIRILLEYANYPVDYTEDSLTIEDEPKVFSWEFINLMKDFYLKL
jgi:tRNA1Val (adenine37-N6)-methyltransferase